MIKRRSILTAGAGSVLGIAAGLLGRTRSATAADSKSEGPDRGIRYANEEGFVPVETLNGSTLPYKMQDGVKVFHLVAEPVLSQFTKGLNVNCWGYNGQAPGPTIEAVQGDRVRIHLTNKLPEATSIHWHGVLLPNEMDGVAGLNQPHVQPGETFTYEFTLAQHGTQMYHPHSDEMTQMALGMMGFFIIHPRKPRLPKVHRDFAIFLNEWRIDSGTATPNPWEMLDFNYFTFNNRVYPATAPLVMSTGQRARVRIANLSMDMHPIHIHGVQFWVTGTDGGPIPESAWWPETTVMVAPGTTRDIEFVAHYPGDWAMHCHKIHHAMNGMVHHLPNLIGVDMGDNEDNFRKLLRGYMAMGQNGMGGMHDMGGPKNTIHMGNAPGPFGPIDMGGMFTVLKVRDDLQSYEDPGWYRTKPDPIWSKYPPPSA